MTVAEQWADVLKDVVVRHPNPSALPSFSVEQSDGDPVMLVSIANHCDTAGKSDARWGSFTISNVRLTYFPGAELARIWVAAAWSGYLQHEALELVTVNGVSPLDPHAPPYRTNPWNRGLRSGFPPVLTPETLVESLAVVMEREHAQLLVKGL